MDIKNADCAANGKANRLPKLAAYFFERLWLPLAGLALDAVLVYAAFYCAYLLRFHCAPVLRLIPPPDIQPFSLYQGLVPALVPLWLLVFFYSARIYSDPHIPPEDVAVRCFQGALLSTLLTLATSFLLRQYWHSRLMMAFVLPVAWLFVYCGNLALRQAQRFALAHCGCRIKVLVAGTGKAAELACARLGGAPWRGCLTCRGDAADEIMALALESGVSHVVLANAAMDKRDLLALADRLEPAGVELSIMPGMLELRTGEVQLDSSLGLPVMKLHHTSLTASNYISKRLFDITFSLAVLCLGLAPFLLIALLIKLDSRGPVLFKQKRVGLNGRIFEIFKFRTMVADAEKRLAGLAHLNERDGNVFKMKNDPRVTRAGALLRKLSLDEFPQFINVLRGEMSVAGPRPPTAAEYGKYDEISKKRLHVLPGITGLWQVSGRAELDFEQMLALDFYYIEHWSLGLDLKIILKTPLAMLSVKGAY